MFSGLIFRTCLILAACIPLMPAAAVGDILATDSFSYPDGELYGTNGGTGWESIWTGYGMDVAGGQAVSNTFGTPYGARVFTNPESAPGLYFAVDLALPAFALADSFYVAGGSGVNNSQIVFGKIAGSNLLHVGNGGYTAGGPELMPNSSLHLVGAYVKNVGAPGDLLMLWINPDGSDYFDLATSAHTADVFRFDFAPFHSHRVFIGASLPGVAFDNLVISNSPGGAGLGSSAIPEPSGLSPLVFMVLVALWRGSRGL